MRTILKNISNENFLFMLAYAFDLNWDYLKEGAGKSKKEDLSYYELLVFVLVKWTEELLRHGLYKNYLEKQEETKRLRGRLLFEPMIKNGRIGSDSLFCKYDDLSYDIIENKIILSTLEYCLSTLNNGQESYASDRKSNIEDLKLQVWELIRILSSEVTNCQNVEGLFAKLVYHRMNHRYRPILIICRIIYDVAELNRIEHTDFVNIPEDKMNIIFERFLRTYLAEKLIPTGYTVGSEKVGKDKWLQESIRVGTDVAPGMSPDIVIRKEGIPVFVIDAKCYTTPVAVSRFDSSEKAHNSNLNQIGMYTEHYDCNGLLIYPEAGTAIFQMWNPKKHTGEVFKRKIGLATIKANTSLAEFKDEMNSLLSNKVLQNLIIRG